MFDDAFFNLTKNLDNNTRATLNYQFQRAQLLETIKNKKEREQLKNEIIEEVLSRIAIDADTTEAVQKIEELQRLIENLGE